MDALNHPHEVGAFGLSSFRDSRFYEIFSGSTGIAGLFNGLNEAVEVLADPDLASDIVWFRVLDTLYALHEMFLQVPGNYMEPDMGVCLFKFTLYAFRFQSMKLRIKFNNDSLQTSISTAPAATVETRTN